MQVHLIDGTYELFRCYFGAPSAKGTGQREVGATRALMRSLCAWLRSGEVTHLGFAFDTVIECFRNDLFAGYKTSEGIDPELYSQFELVERGVRALGIRVWSMIDFEADDAIATAARKLANDPRVDRILLCSPDKDLAQCVSGNRILLWDRRAKQGLDEAGVIAKFGVSPQSIPDLLALVGDTADGIPGIERWGIKSAAAVLSAYGSLDRIPDDASQWTVRVRGAEKMAANLVQERSTAILYRKLATLRFDVPLSESLEDMQWKGADLDALRAFGEEIGDSELVSRLPQP